MTLEFRIGSADSEHLSIAVHGRERGGADDPWDGNWVTTTVSVAVGGFAGRVRASLRLDEIRRFNEGLKSINKNLVGTAVLETMEDWISVTVTVGARGQVEVSGELRDAAGAGNVLSFELAEVDQTYLAGWIGGLDAIEEAFHAAIPRRRA